MIFMILKQNFQFYLGSISPDSAQSLLASGFGRQLLQPCIVLFMLAGSEMGDTRGFFDPLVS